MMTITWTDIPDPDVIRVGDVYYMTSTTMYFNPGCPIMKSQDLIDWEIIGYVYDKISDSDKMTLTNRQNDYGNGTWASCLRYHNGVYYVAVAANSMNETYIFQTRNIENGKWDRYVLDGIYHDMSILFDDGRVFMVYGAGTIKLIELTSDCKKIKPNGLNKVIIENADISGGNSLAEGSHIYKIGGFYYIFIICWPKTGTKRRVQVCYRSDRIDGEYEGKVILDETIGFQNAGIAQGGIVDTPSGDWFGLFFQDHGAVGRIPVCLPMKWEDGWPVLECAESKKFSSLKGIIKSDEFDLATMSLTWQWNHNPVDECWSLDARPGWLRLTTESICSSIYDARNTLTQRTYGPNCSGSVCIDVRGIKDGDVCGLAALQDDCGFVGVIMECGVKSVVMATYRDVICTDGCAHKNTAGKCDAGFRVFCAAKGHRAKIIKSVPLYENTIYLSVDFKFADNDCNIDEALFYYGLDGSKWHRIGENLKLTYKLTHFTGYRFALFNFATKQVGGFADFDYFRLQSNQNI